jgi:hypothetical protein
VPRFVEIQLVGHSFRARVLEDRAPGAAAALWSKLPMRARLHLDLWSGFLARVNIALPIHALERDDKLAFAYPGLVMVDANNGGLAVCYGQARLQSGLGPIPAVPLLELGGADLPSLASVGERLQYTGSQEIQFAVASDQESALIDAPRESSRRLVVELGGVSAVADVLERTSTVTAAAFVAKLPLTGTATSTFLSGPLVRFRDPDDASAELSLDTRDQEITHVVLYPGVVYYRPIPPRGLRIALRDPTTMGGGILGGSTRLVPLARFLGDWSAVSAQAARLVEHGQMPLRLGLLS